MPCPSTQVFITPARHPSSRTDSKYVSVPHAPGVYLFTEHDNHRYIGRANDLNNRFGQHVAASSRHNHAAFAFNIAKRAAEQEGLISSA